MSFSVRVAALGVVMAGVLTLTNEVYALAAAAKDDSTSSPRTYEDLCMAVVGSEGGGFRKIIVDGKKINMCSCTDVWNG